jgi:hypothetical protein
MCWKCRDKITEGDESGAFRIVGCKAEIGIKDFHDAQKMCPLIGKFSTDEKAEGGKKAKNGDKKPKDERRLGYEVCLVPLESNMVRVRRIVSTNNGEVVSSQLVGWAKTFEEAEELVHKDRLCLP